MKALIVVALLCTFGSLKAENASSHAAAALAAAGANVSVPQISPNTVRSEKVNACVQQRVNLAKSSFSPFVGGPVGSSDYK